MLQDLVFFNRNMDLFITYLILESVLTSGIGKTENAPIGPIGEVAAFLSFTTTLSPNLIPKADGTSPQYYTEA